MNLDYVYNNRFGLHDGVRSLGWGSHESQQIRFKILLEIKGYTIGDSVLDVGCGLGDMSQLVNNYTGIDLRQSVLEQAKIKYPNVRLFCFGTKAVDASFDWVFASGIFCFCKGWEKQIRTEIREMLRIASKGVAFNILSRRSQGSRKSGIKYATVCEFMSVLGKNVKRFVIRHDYLDNDFTVYIYKI
jgi:ubiquinone/menaquinone biosynthesis C-methylase UbiE